MAIPLSNEMKEVRSPQAANIQPVDDQRMLNAMGESALAINRQTQDAIRGGMNAWKQASDQRDAFRRNEAERIYNERTSQLNTELAQKQGIERQKFQPKYEAEMKLASDTYEASINKIRNQEIREGSKRSINAWNIRNASNYQYANYQNDYNLRQKSMGQAVITGNKRRIDAITAADNANSLWALYNDPNLGFAHEEQLIRDFYSKDAGMPDDIVEQYVQDYRSKSMIAMANRFAQVTDQVDSNAAYDGSLNFLQKGIDSGLIGPEEGIEAKRNLEKEKITMIAETQPRLLVNNDGTYRFNTARRFAPDLTREELYRHIKTASANSNGGANTAFQNLIGDKALEIWNATVSAAGLGDRLATEKYWEQNAKNFEGQDNNGKIRGHKLLELVKIVNLGEQLTNGYMVLEADGTYTPMRDGEAPAAIKARGAQIVPRAIQQELNEQVQQAKTMLTSSVLDGSFEDVFSPDLFKASEKASIEEKALIAQLRNIKKAYPAKSAWLPLKIKVGLNRLGIRKFDTQIMRNLTRDVVDEGIKGAQLGLAEATKKYGIDVDSTENLNDKTVRLKQWNPDTNKYEIIPDLEPVPLSDALSLDIAMSTMRRMDDGLFHTIYGENAVRPQSIQELQHYGGYQLDFGSGDGGNVISGIANKGINFAVNTAMNIGSLGMYKILSGGDDVISVKPFKATDAQISNAFKQAIASFEPQAGAGSIGDVEFMQKQFLESAYSGKEDNTPWTYGEFVSKVGEATPESYRAYLGNKGALDRASRVIVETDALNKEKPGHFFLSNSYETDGILSDMYKKALGVEPSNPNYIGKDITIKDVLATAPLGFKAPVKAFDKPALNANYSEKEVNDGAPVFFLTKSGTAYIIHNDSIRHLDATPTEFVNLLGILNEYGAGGEAPTEPIANVYDKSQISPDFK